MALVLNRVACRQKPLGVLRACRFRLNADYSGSFSAVLVLNRGAGGRPGKRRKHRGDFKASSFAGRISPIGSATPFACSRLLSLTASLEYRSRKNCCSFKSFWGRLDAEFQAIGVSYRKPKVIADRWLQCYRRKVLSRNDRPTIES